ncbi:MAG: hypothetical protein HY554_00255 [Elusimicrobia bacterium]|nr:hypothetical protein [Elusimicrobiota bacterium]
MLWNPAGLGRVAKPEVTLSHVALFEDTISDLGVAAFPLRAWGGAALGYLRQSSGGFERRTGPLDSPTAFSITQTALLAGWGRSFAVLPFPARAGVAVKLVNEKIDTFGASGSGADLGFGVDPLPRLQLGLLVQNALAPRLTFRSVPQKYPRTVDATGAYTLGNPKGLHAVAALRMVSTGDEGRRVGGGAELWYDALAAVRLGADGRGWTTGVGFKLGNFHIDYAAMLQDLGTAHQMSLRVQFGQTREELEALIQRGIQKFTKDEARRLARAYVASAERYQEEGNYPRAINDLEAAALWAPDDVLVSRKLQELTSQVEQTVQRQILERTTLLAEQQFKRGNWIASQTHWRSVLDLEPANARARDTLTRIEHILAERAEQEAAERVAQAQRAERAQREAAEQAAQARRVERSRKEALALVAAGEAALLEGRYDDAAARSIAAFKVVPGLPEADSLREKAQRERALALKRLLAEGERFHENKLFQKAIDSFQAALALDSRSQAARDGVARAREAARPELGAAARKQIEKTYYLAVDAYLKGRYQEASRHLDDIFKLDLSDENARKLKEKVEAALKLEAR